MAKKEIQPYWRPDYRISETLPDIKVIRTDFIVNFISIGAVLIYAFFVIQKEYRAIQISGDVADLESQISSLQSSNKSALSKSREFVKASHLVADIERFYDTPFKPYVFLESLAEIRVEDLIFSSLTFNENPNLKTKQVAYALQLSGISKGLPAIDEFKNLMLEDELLQLEGYELSVVEVPQAKDEATGNFPYMLSFTLEPESKKKGKK